MAYIDTLIEKFPIRKTKLQKECFRNWVMDECVKLGYTAQVETKGSSNNVVIGDADKAEAIFTAHYDTPAVMPVPNFITPCNVLVYLLYQIVLTVAIFAVSGLVAGSLGWLAKIIFGDGELAFWVGYLAELVSLFGLLGLMLFGPANKNNANDNTSGVAAVFALMEKLPAEQRSKAAFILWDNEEKGMLGSKAFAKEHPKLAHLALVVNLDCVGLGENIIMVVNKLARKLPAVDTLEKAMQNTSGRAFQMFRSVSWLLNSDHKSFKCGVMVCACRKAKVLGYYTPYIHTGKDTVIDQENIPYLAEGLSAFVAALPEENV